MERIEFNWEPPTYSFERADNVPEFQQFSRSIGLVENRKFEIYLQMTIMGGYRVIGNFVGDGGLNFSWCCGKDLQLASVTLLQLIIAISFGCPLKEIPFCSDIKPYPLDSAFIEKVKQLFTKYNGIDFDVWFGPHIEKYMEDRKKLIPPQ